MLRDLLIGLPTMSVCLLLQSLLLVTTLRYYTGRDRTKTDISAWMTLVVVNGVMILLVIGNIAQVVIWAIVFRMLGEFETLRAAIYHSAVNFATLGYGDVVMSERNRLLGPMEAINGALMIGVSTAALMATFQDVIKRGAQARRGANPPAGDG